MPSVDLLALGRVALRTLCCDSRRPVAAKPLVLPPAVIADEREVEEVTPGSSVSNSSAVAAMVARAKEQAGPRLTGRSVAPGSVPSPGLSPAAGKRSPSRSLLLRRASKSHLPVTGNERVHGISDTRLSIYAAFTPAIVH